MSMSQYISCNCFCFESLRLSQQFFSPVGKSHHGLNQYLAVDKVLCSLGHNTLTLSVVRLELHVATLGSPQSHVLPTEPLRSAYLAEVFFVVLGFYRLLLITFENVLNQPAAYRNSANQRSFIKQKYNCITVH